PQAAARLDPPAPAGPRRRRPLDLARDRRLRPALDRPPPRRRLMPALAAAPPGPRGGDPRAGPRRVPPRPRDRRHPRQPGETPQPRPRTPQRLEEQAQSPPPARRQTP